MTLDPKHKSHALTEGPSRAPARAMLKAVGFSDADLHKPLVGIANTWTEIGPCNFHLRRLAAKVKEGVREAGGTPMEFNTVAVSDGITMGAEGMRTSLISREVIADSIELVVRGHHLDAVVMLCGCDKTIPGTLMALARMNLPGVVLYGGSIAPGTFEGHDVTIQDVFEAVGAHAAGKMSDARLRDLEDHACPGAGACGGQFTANTMAMACEFLGVAPFGSASVPAVLETKDAVAKSVGALAMDLLKRGVRPRDILTREAFENAIAGVVASGGSTNAVLHLLALANEAGVPLTIDDFNPISDRTPLIVDLKPGGKYVATDLHKAGGVPLVGKRLAEARLLHGGAMTVTGKTIGEEAAAARETAGQQVVRTAADPDQEDRRPGHPARQPRPGRLCREDRRLRGAQPHGPGPRVRQRGSDLRGAEGRPDQGGRRGRHPLRGPERRSRDARDAGGHRRDPGRGPRRIGRAAHGRPLLRRDPRPDGRPRGARSGARRPDRGGARGRHHHV